MTNEGTPQDRPRGIRPVRVEAFSDGVFAIAITLLVLEITVPAAAENDLPRALADQWPSYLAYLVSFATIGVVWLRRSIITEYLERANAGFVRLNLLLLMVVSFIPFPTRLLAEHIGRDSAERVAATVYGITLFIAAILVSTLWRYAVRERLVRPEAGDESVGMLTERLTPALASYVAMIILGLFLPFVAVLGYLAIAVFFILPFRLGRTHSPGRPDSSSA